MKLFLLCILTAVCPLVFAQQAAAPAAPKGQAKEENAPRQIPAKIIAGTVIAVDAEKHSLSVTRTDDGGAGAKAVFTYNTRMRIYQRNKPMTLQDLVPGTGVKVHYSENRDGSLLIRRVMIDPPKADAPTQPGGTGN